MRWLVAGVLTLHGFIHVMGFAKAFGLAELPQLAQPISRAMGVAWLLAGGLVATTAALVVTGWRHAWLVGALAAFASQAVILSAWRDAWAGSLANVVLLLVAMFAWFTEGPRSFRAQFDHDAAAGLARSSGAPLITDADLAPLPEAVRRYLRLSGAVGQPRVRDYRLRFRGRIRSGPNTRWMPFEAEQHSFADPPMRLFHMRARMYGLPVDVFHRLADGHATMRVRLFGAIPMADARGDVMDRSESVTLFNDMCLLAPGTLVDPGIAWQSIDPHSVRAQFTHGPHTIAAVLTFDDEGWLTNFVSDDRSRAAADGRSFTAARFSTPVRDYRRFGPLTLAAYGEARWVVPEGEFVYGEFHIAEAAVNLRPR